MKFTLCILPLCLLAACASGPCKGQVKNQDAPPAIASASDAPASDVGATSATSPVAANTSRVRIYKADGSRQCGKGKAIDLKVMESELTKAGVKVISSAKQSDGMMHTQVCGAATGMANTYEINATDLSKATKLGFSRLEN